MSNLTKADLRWPIPIRIVVSVIALLFILGGAAYLRLVGLDWDDNQHLHPDERFLTMVTSAIQPVGSVGEYFDTVNSTLNPNNMGFGFYVYGNLPVMLTRLIGEIADKTSYYDVYLVGRVISAVADLSVLLLIFFIGKTLFDWRAGLLSAFLYGAAALPIQLSHFYTVDTITNLFVTAFFLFLARLVIKHSWLDCIVCGIFLGLAVASKVNVFPLGLLLGLILILRVFREYNGTQQSETPIPLNSLLVPALGGLLIAGVLSIVTFRLAQPYAFLSVNSEIPIDEEALGPAMTLASKALDPVGFRPNPIWLAQMSEVQGMVSGYSDIPPNHQWGSRLPVVFPWVNMVGIGLGWPLGLFCWLMFAFAIWEIWHGHTGFERLLPLVIWVGFYFVWQGVGWVKTMRYFLPVYPFLILLAGWGLIVCWDRIQDLLRRHRIDGWHGASASVALVGLGVVIGGYGWGYAVSRIYTRPVTRIEATEWILNNAPSDITLRLSTKTGPQTYQLGLHNNAPFPLPREDEQGPTRPLISYTQLTPGIPNTFALQLSFDGTLSEISLNHLVAASTPSRTRSLDIKIARDSSGQDVLFSTSVESSFEAGEDPRGDATNVKITSVTLNANTPYYLILQPNGDTPINVFGSTITTEGDWDDPLPLSMAPYDVWGAQFQGYKLQMAWEDLPEKRERIKYILDNTDYITISSNRFYGSLSRNPNRFPLTIAYYQALFSGKLGFDLVGDFTSRPSIGPVEFVDDNAEEAWTVYDHPRVFIFKKSPRYDPALVSSVLNQIDLTNTQRVIAKDAKGSPVNIELPKMSTTASSSSLVAPDLVVNGFHNFYEVAQPLTIIIWWLAISIVGWVTFPILYRVFTGLPDRGLGFSRILGLLLLPWLTWILASVRLAPWSWGLAFGVLIGCAAFSQLLIVRRYNEFREWLMNRRRHIVFTEALFAVLYLFFVLVRLGNPDLWHPSFGGEKPMDLSYLNAVLKSTYFPPYDPWFAGGTINYYYFGMMIAAYPIKLLSMPTTLAYNLLVPTFFALTGCAAFSFVYNISAAHLPGHDYTANNKDAQPNPVIEAIKTWPQTSLSQIVSSMQSSTGQPVQGSSVAYIGGVAGLLLTAVLGNLDQIRTLLWGLAEAGAGHPAWANSLFPPMAELAKGVNLVIGQGDTLPVGLGEWYWNATRLIPVPIVNEMPTEVGPITEFPYFTFLYADLHAHMTALPLTLLALGWCLSFIRGASQKTLGGFTSASFWGHILLGALIIGALRPTNTWDFPTYLLLGGVAVVLATYINRQNEGALGALAIGGIAGLALGIAGYMFLTTQSMGAIDQALLPLIVAAVLGGIGLTIGYGVGLAVLKSQTADGKTHSPFYDWVTFLQGAAATGILVAFTFVFFLPYILTFKLGYTSFIPWEGSKTPLWAFLDICGLPLFIIVTWLATEVSDWYSRRQQSNPMSRSGLILLVLTTGMVATISVGIGIAGLEVLAVAFPLFLICILLGFGTEMPAEKRLILVMIAIAMLLGTLVESVVLVGDIARMNTVFKFYFQIWVLLAISGGAALAWVWDRVAHWHEAPKTVWRIALSILVFLASLYPLLATRAKIEDRWTQDVPASLDGMAYMPHVERYENGVVFSLKGDYEALQWIQDNITGTPVILEAHTIEYMWGSRVAVYTGLPTALGWNWHQRQQRGGQSDEVWAREADLSIMYNTPNLEHVMSLLHRYNIQLVLVGELERAYYTPEGLQKFQQLVELGYLKVLYDDESTTIYGVVSQ